MARAPSDGAVGAAQFSDVGRHRQTGTASLAGRWSKRNGTPHQGEWVGRRRTRGRGRTRGRIDLVDQRCPGHESAAPRWGDLPQRDSRARGGRLRCGSYDGHQHGDSPTVAVGGPLVTGRMGAPLQGRDRSPAQCGWSYLAGQHAVRGSPVYRYGRCGLSRRNGLRRRSAHRWITHGRRGASPEQLCRQACRAVLRWHDRVLSAATRGWKYGARIWSGCSRYGEIDARVKPSSKGYTPGDDWTVGQPAARAATSCSKRAAEADLRLTLLRPNKGRTDEPEVSRDGCPGRGAQRGIPASRVLPVTETRRCISAGAQPEVERGR